MDFKSLQESYLSVYDMGSQEVISEEVEIASEYFASLGLNEEGVEIFAEELGHQDFYNFVMELAEEYTLNEATALTGKRPAPAPKGSDEAKISRKAKAGKTTKDLVKAGGGQMKSGRVSNTMSKTKRTAPAPSAPKVAAATTKAQAAQPKKRPGLDGIARAINKGMDRHRKAMGLAKETGKTIGKAAGVAKEAGRRLGQTKGGQAVKKGLGKALSSAGKRLSEDTVEYLEAYLIGEGHAGSQQEAYELIENMDAQLIYDILMDW